MRRHWQHLLFAAFLLPAAIAAAPAEKIGISPKLPGWRFSNGPEFPGASGSANYSGGGIMLDGDFSRGGNYVGVFHEVSNPDFNELRFRIKASVEQLAVRFRDSKGQVHQHFISVGLDSPGWIELAVPVAGSPRHHWGGANDGILRGPVTEIGFVVHKDHFDRPKGRAAIRDVRLCRSDTPPQVPLDIAKFDASKATVNGQASIRKEKDALIIEIPGGQSFTWPGVNLKPQNGGSYFDLSGGSVLAMDVTNLAGYPATFRCQIENLGADGREFCVKGGRGFEAGETATMRIRFYRDGIAPDDVVFEGVLNPFEGLRGANNLDVKKVTNIMLFEHSPARDLKFAVRNIRLEEPWKGVSDAVRSAKTFYPAIDVYGQYKHKEWNGKTHSDAELAAAFEAEKRDLAAHPAIAGLNRFGGWADGPSFEATGSFRTLKHDGKWYLVDPEGKLFFSHGIDQFSGSETTGFELREHYFENLPQKSDPETRGLWGTSNPAPGKNFYRLKNLRPAVFNYYGRNLKRKYGDDWRNIHRRLMHDRAASWGINTLGNWSWGDYARVGRTPYCLQAYSDGPVIKGHTGTWQHFEDVFDPKFEESIVSNLSRGWKFAAGDPMCIGAFVDNEHRWGNETALAEAVLRSPADQAAKQEFRRRLEKRYGDIAGLNAAWKSSYASWDAFAAETALPDPDAAKDDLKAFNDALIERYFEGCRAAVKRVLPGKLYLGCRFAGVPRAELVKTAAKYCDLLSFNLYQYSVADFKLPDGIDMPVMIGEFHFGTINNGHSHPGLVACADDAERGEAYRHYLKSVLRHPNFVGCHYYRMIDEHPAGRTLDNENMGVGFLDICDRPCPEMVRAARDIAGEMYDIRANRQ